MWLSAVWGRMISAGVNPYYQLFTPDTLPGLPLDHFPMVMSYGPLWGIVSAIVMLVAGNSILATGILFKAVLAGRLDRLARPGRADHAQAAGARAVPCHLHVRLGTCQRVAVAGRGPQRYRAGRACPAVDAPPAAGALGGTCRPGCIGALQVRRRRPCCSIDAIAALRRGARGLDAIPGAACRARTCWGSARWPCSIDRRPSSMASGSSASGISCGPAMP